jgi:signal transduction histidine kinase/ActR/RegA family two-component response regulator
MRDLFRSSSAVLICAPNHRDVELLQATLHSAGFTTEACPDLSRLAMRLGDNVLALLLTEEALGPTIVERLRRFIDDQPVWSDFPIVVFTGPDSNGRYLNHLDALGPRANVTLVDRPARIKSVTSIVNGVARARMRQYEIRDLLAKLEDRIAERDRFLAILGHELRNPLGAIVLAAQMVDPADSKLDAQHAERIERQAHHVASLVDDLLDLSRVTTGKIALKRTPLDLNQLVEHALKALQTDRFRRNLDLHFEPSPEPLILNADPLRIEQIIANLVTNAFKYTPEGGTITIRTEQQDGHAVFTIADTGVGIAPDRIASIFELFSQAENAIGRSQGGMGIGLNLVRTLVELHGGTVEAKSDGVNKGSTFTVRLPLAAEMTTPAKVMTAEVKRGELLTCPSRRIVVVDDNADIRDLLQIKLKKLGHDVETAADGQTGLQRIVSARPDVAIIDIGMPGLDGYELARQLRQTLSKEILLIALTGFGQSEDKEKAAAAGFDEHLTKPIRAEDLQRIFVRRFQSELA